MRIFFIIMAVLLSMSGLASADPMLKTRLEFSEKPQAAPNFYFYDMQEQPLQIADFEGQILILHIWRISCPICVYELPLLKDLEMSLDRRNYRILTIHSGDEAPYEVKRFLVRFNIPTGEVFIDKNARFSRVIRSDMLPVTIIIDREGREIGRTYGAVDWNSPTVIKQLLELK